MTPAEALDELTQIEAIEHGAAESAVAVLRQLVEDVKRPARRLPRDRWVGASPGSNVTPPGQALEALDAVRRLMDRLATDPDGGVQNVRAQVLLTIDRIMVAP